MYGKGIIKVLEGVIELRAMSLFVGGCKMNKPCFFGWLIKGGVDACVYVNDYLRM
jgi:hypothetical protein